MNIFHFTYNLLTSGLAPIVLPALWCQAKKDPAQKAALAQRLGYDLQNHVPVFSSRPVIWIHAVSVGEVKAAEAVVHALDSLWPQASILLTTTTTTGQRYALRQFGKRAMVRYAPVDLWRAVGRFLSTYRPDLLVCMETEIWPNWIVKAHGAGIKIVFINGRISTRSIRSYLKVRPLIKPVLEKVDAFSMISEADAQRIIALGAPAQRVQINGNVKMDAREANRNDAGDEDLKRLFCVDDHMPVFVAGSIRGAEARMLIRVYTRLAAEIPGLIFIVAPRHIENASRIAELAHEEGIRWQYRTELGQAGIERHAPLVILDTIGELKQVYRIASVVFCGASLVPLGGQNVLEAAVWAKPVLFGPFMEDFAEAKTLLERCGGGEGIKDEMELAERALHLLTHPDTARQMGCLARQAVLANQGAALRHARVISRLLSDLSV